MCAKLTMLLLVTRSTVLATESKSAISVTTASEPEETTKEKLYVLINRYYMKLAYKQNQNRTESSYVLIFFTDNTLHYKYRGQYVEEVVANNARRQV